MRAKQYIAREKLTTGDFCFSCWVSQEIRERLDRIVEKEGITRSIAIRAALLAFLDAYEEAEKEGKRKTAENASRSLPPRRLGYGV